jgi:ATPase subunit of ABC transporter with duplicated ATPase domains
LALKQRTESNKKTDEKRKELEEFIRRFSANASKSKQATSRQKLLSKLTLEDIKPSSRRYPYIQFKPEREAGNQLLTVDNLSKKLEDGTVLFKDITFTVEKKDKIAVLGRNDLSASTFFEILNGDKKGDSGSFTWGTTITTAFFPKDNAHYFETDLNLVDWLRQFSEEKDESFIRGFLGRMLFTGEESLKKANVLSGGEKVRCMLSKMMLQSGNFLMLDEPTNHLDLESITALNNGLKDFGGTILFSSHDLQFVDTIANRIIELTPKGIIDKRMSYEEYLADEQIKALRQKMYS